MRKPDRITVVEYGFVIILNAMAGLTMGALMDGDRPGQDAASGGTARGSWPAAAYGAAVRTELPPGVVLGGSIPEPGADRARLMHIDVGTPGASEAGTDLLRQQERLGYTVSSEVWRRAEHRELMARTESLRR